jgi:serine/threonine-protein kinase
MDAMLGRVLGHCELVARLGGGGMGTVYRGVHQTLQQPRAIKLLRPDLADEPDVVARFRREAMIAAGLRHPNIVLIYDVAEQDGLHYLVMDLLEGGTLRDVIRSSAPLSVERAVELLRPLASALDYAHAHGVIHRDVKPGNVMVSAEGHVTLVDFGIARAADEARLTRSGTVVGTAEYMAPEAFAGDGSDQNGDRYALGVIAYELLTGHTPFRGNPTAVSYAQVHSPAPSPCSFEAAIPTWTEQALLRQLAKRPADRFPDASSFVQALAAGPSHSAADDPTITIPRSAIQPGISPPPPTSPAPAPPSSTPPRPIQMPPPPPPRFQEQRESGTVFHDVAPGSQVGERGGGSGGRLAAFALIVLALVVAGSVAVWQWTASPASVAQAPPAPTVASAPSAGLPATNPPPTAPAAPAAPAAKPAAPTVPAVAPTAAPPAPAVVAAVPPAASGPTPTAPATPVPVVVAPATAAPKPGSPTASSPAFQPVLDERFADNQRGWPNNQESTAWLTNGVYRLEVRNPGRFVSVGAPGLGAFTDVEVSGRFKKVGGPPGGGYGLIVRDQGPDARDGLSQGGRYYVLEVGEGTQWGMWRRETDRWVDLQPFIQSSAVRPPPEVNELTARAVGSHLIFVVNGVQVADIVDGELANGKVGIYVAGDGNVVEAEQFTVRAPR